MSTQNAIEVKSNQEIDLQKRLNEVVEKNPLAGRHSYFQLKYFILGKENTLQAKLWQCMREMKARKETLEGLDLEQEETKDKIELLKLKIERLKPEMTDYEISKKEMEIKDRQIRRRILSLERSLANLGIRRKEIEEEAGFFIQAFDDLSKVGAMKSYDDPESQTEYWASRFSNEMNMKIMLDGRIDVELAKAVLSLPDQTLVKQELVSVLHKQQLALETKRNAERTILGAK